MSQLVVIGEEYEWIKYASDALVVAYPEELEFVIDDDGIVFYYAKKEIKPSFVLWRVADEKPYRPRLLGALQNGGIRTVNKPDIIFRCENQFSVLTLLAQNGIPIPKTISLSGSHMPKFTYPAVLKTEGVHRGEKKVLVKNDEVLGSILPMLSFNSSRYLLQEYLEVENDYRVLVIGGKVIDIAERISDHWIKSRDATAQILPIEVPDISSMALKATNLLGAEIAGIDIVRTVEDKYFLLEVVTEPGFKAFGEVAYKAVMEYLKKTADL